MKKDILFPKVEDVAIAIVEEEGLEKEPIWNVYVINLKPEELTGVLVTSKGYGIKNKEQVKTSLLRHFLETVDGNGYKKIEPIPSELFGLTSEYWLSFYHKGQMYDKKYIFLPESIQKKNYTLIPVIEKPGVMIK